MKNAENTASNRDRILQEAERLFSEKGFDATSVSSVAQAAGVNKALVYYYFENKDDLLASLFARMVDEVRTRTGPAAQRASLKEKVASEVASLADRRRTLALMLMQALKQDAESPALFSAASNLIEEELARRGFPRSAAEEPPSKEHQKALVHEFFTGLIPVIAFATLRDKFCAHFGLDQQEADALFLDALEQSHFRSHVEPSGSS